MKSSARKQTTKLVLGSMMALMVSGWTSLQTVFALGAYMFGGPDAFPFKLSKSIEGTVYLTIAFWDMVYLAVLISIRRFCRHCDHTIAPLVMAVFPAVLVYLSGIFWEGWQQPASFWSITFVVQLLISGATLGRGFFIHGQRSMRSGA